MVKTTTKYIQCIDNSFTAWVILPLQFNFFTPLPPEFPAVTGPQSGSILMSPQRLATSYKVLHGTRETHHLPASAAQVTNWPWCPSVQMVQEVCPLASDWSQRKTQCWIWLTGTSLTTWSKPTPVLLELGEFECSCKLYSKGKTRWI